MILIKVEEIRIRFDLGHRPSYSEEFLLGSHSLRSDRLSGPSAINNPYSTVVWERRGLLQKELWELRMTSQGWSLVKNRWIFYFLGFPSFFGSLIFPDHVTSIF
jgi:hypothetical protein